MATTRGAAAKSPASAKTRKPKAAAKKAPKPAAKSARKAKPKPQAAAADKPEKQKKLKVVRDSFTIPKAEYAALAELKLRAAKLGRPTKKSEVLRAGVQALAAMGDAAFLAAVGAVPAIKTGRPAKA